MGDHREALYATQGLRADWAGAEGLPVINRCGRMKVVCAGGCGNWLHNAAGSATGACPGTCIFRHLLLEREAVHLNWKKLYRLYREE